MSEDDVSSEMFTDDDQTPLNGNWTMRQRIFVAEYMVDFNATSAAIRAGYTKENAKSIAYQIMQREHIKEDIAKQVETRMQRLSKTADDVIIGMQNIAFADLRHLSPELLAGIPDSTAMALASVKLSKRASGEIDDDGRPVFEDVVEYKMADRNAALTNLAKIHKLLIDRSESKSEVKHNHEVKFVRFPSKDPLPDADGNPVTTDDGDEPSGD